MKLQGQSLSPGSKGNVVKLLHTELRQLKVAVPDAEANESIFGDGTRQAVVDFQKLHGLATTGIVDEATAVEINRQVDAIQTGSSTFIVRGTVRNSQGDPLPGLTVRAFDADLPSLNQDQPLGQPTQNGKDGTYSISYTTDQFSNFEKDTADLLVQAVDAKNQVIAASDILFNAPPDAEINLVIAADDYRGPSEFERLMAAIAPLIGKIGIADLTGKDLTFLTGELAADPRYLSFLVTAHRYAAATKIAAAVFYGLLRQQLAKDLFALLQQQRTVLQHALEASLDANLIPASLRSDLTAILDELKAQAVQLALKSPDTNQPTKLAGILGTALPSPDQQATFLALYNDHQGDIQSFWASLAKEPAFAASNLAGQIQFSLQLGALTGGNAPLVQLLRKDQNLKSTRDLIGLDEAAWRERISATAGDKGENIPPKIGGATRDERVTNYAKATTGTLKSAFPMAYVVKGLSQPPAIDASLIKQVRDLNNDLDITKPLPNKLEWGAIPEADRQKAIESFRLLRAEMAMFPNSDIRSNIERAVFANPVRTAVSTFLSQSPDFDLASTDIDKYISEKTAVPGSTEQSTRAILATQLKAMQRVYKVVPRYEAMSALMGAGFHSASDMAQVPEPVFMSMLSPQFGGFYTRIMYDNAIRTADFTTAVAGAVTSVYDVTPRVIRPPEVPRDTRATYPALFGRFNLCECEDCRSVYSPAAYLVDLLHFLDPKPEQWSSMMDNWQSQHGAPYPFKTGPDYDAFIAGWRDQHAGADIPNLSQTPLEVFNQRRPDIQHLKLTCENTNTAMPYIDLVNEVLEAYIAHSAVPDAALGDTGPSLTSQELLAAPEPAIDQTTAYDTLKLHVYPFTLPYNSDLDVIRTYLGNISLTRHRVMRTFQPVSPLPDARQFNLALEYLKINPEDVDILTGTSFARDHVLTVSESYGYAGGTIPFELSTVSNFLDRTGLEYAELARILKTQFINPSGPGALDSLVISNQNTTCDPAQRMLRRASAMPSDNDWDRLQGFIRLWRKLSWPIQDVDRALTALAPADLSQPGFKTLDVTFLRRLGTAVHLRDDLGLSLAETLSFWADIDTQGDDTENGPSGSLYARLFLNRTVRDLARNPGAFDLSPRTPPTLTDNAHAVQAALRLTADELSALQTRTNVDGALNVANLSKLHRYAALARTLRLTVTDLLDLELLTSLKAFDAASGADLSEHPTAQDGTTRFIQIARKVQSSGFSIPLLNYLFRHQDTPRNSIDLRPDEVDARLKQVRSELRKIVQDAGTRDERTRRLLASVMDSGDIDAAIGLLNGTAVYTAPLAARLLIPPADPLGQKIQYDNGTHTVRFIGAMTEREKSELLAPPIRADGTAVGTLFDQPHAFIRTKMNRFLPDASEAISRIIETADLDERHAFAAGRALDFLSRDAVVQTLGTALNLEPDITRELLTGALHSPGTTNPILQDFLALRVPAPTPSGTLGEPPFPEPSRRALLLVYKASLLVNGLRLKASEIAYLADHTDSFAGFQLNDLPLNAGAADRSPRLVSGWEKLYDLATFRAGLALPDDFSRVLEAADLETAKSALVAAATWDETTFTSAIGADALNVTDIAQLKDGALLLQLNPVLKMAVRIGVRPDQAFAWFASATTHEANEVQSAVKAKYDAQQWLTVAKTLNDPLRERRRSAMVDYILTMPGIRLRGITTSNELFEFFLIDVDMGACMATSRVKQAISSVQLFIQRCFMGLEWPAVSPFSLNTKWWEWMRNYRVWEANRKVFLYPENWIDESLRDDKSPFFKELENELLQNDITNDTAEAALLHYLEKLDEVARLDARAVYWEHESELTWDQTPPANGSGLANEPQDRADILHVFARTQGTPPVYYYRQLENRNTWRPWEKLQLDIEGDHLIPVVYNRRLYLFWPLFRETTDTDQSLPQRRSDGSVPDPTPPQRWRETHLAWSEYKDGQWSAKKTSTDFFRLDSSPNLLSFTVYNDGGGECFIACTDHPALGSEQGFKLDTCTGDLQLRAQTRQREQLLQSLPLWARDYQQFTFSASVGFPFERLGEIQFVFPTPEGAQQALRGFGKISVTTPRQNLASIWDAPFFYQDEFHQYFVEPEQQTNLIEQVRSPEAVRIVFITFIGPLQEQQAASTTTVDVLTDLSRPLQPWSTTAVCASDIGTADSPEESDGVKIRFETFYHPYVCYFIRGLKRRGVPGLLDLDNQKLDESGDPSPASHFQTRYQPNADVVDSNYPLENVDFDGGAYSSYNWELFFHVPLLIATRLNANHRFEEARRWFHFIFDPTTDSSDPVPQRFWKTVPFNRNGSAPQEQITDILEALSNRSTDPAAVKRRRQIEAAVERWRSDPFNPHLVARTRITAYQKTVVMKYIDNLIEWGDQLFSQDTIESINEATQLYVLAYLMLGKRPEVIPQKKPDPKTYSDLRPLLDDFSNALVSTENSVARRPCPPLVPRSGTAASASRTMGTLYFCIPKNEKLLSYWDAVEDRLFKIRHCMNMEGIVRQLPLFEPPIEPELLVRARVAGLDLTTLLTEASAPAPHYRFALMLQKAVEFCSEVRSLGAAFLATAEKRDAEELALLRSVHELRMLNVISELRQKQVDEAEQTIASLEATQAMVEARRDFYRDVVQLNAAEVVQLALSASSIVSQALELVPILAASPVEAIPMFTVGVAGFGGSPVGTMTYGGGTIGDPLETFGKAMGVVSSMFSGGANMAGTIAGYQRRWDEWKLQEQLANKELDQIEKQLEAARIRRDIATAEKQNHQIQIDQTKTVDEYLRSRKFTRQDLYDWMTAQLSSVYFQAYQLAYDMAKRAERAYQRERGVDSSNFVRFGQWDSLRKGLLAGEQLHLDIRRLEAAYLDQNRRDYEITKNVSLAQLDPVALIQLKQNGACEFSIGEGIFDLDYPGHYMRRIKSVALTIPAVVGPYTSVNCTLTLLSSQVRTASIVVSAEEYQDKTRLPSDHLPVQSIATSHVQNDAGTFELNFRDERFLPFETAGAISTWRIEMPQDCNAFDFDTLSDVIVHLRYAARDGGDALKTIAKQVPPGPGFQLFTARRDFSNEWYRFLHSDSTAGDQTLTLAIQDRAPYWAKTRNMSLRRIDFYIKLNGNTVPAFSVDGTRLALVDIYGLKTATHDVRDPGPFQLTAWIGPDDSHHRISPGVVEDIAIVCGYTRE